MRFAKVKCKHLHESVCNMLKDLEKIDGFGHRHLGWANVEPERDRNPLFMLHLHYHLHYLLMIISIGNLYRKYHCESDSPKYTGNCK